MNAKGTLDSWHYVALFAEGVDRNNNIRKILAMLDKSPSSRRAWIEIMT